MNSQLFGVCDCGNTIWDGTLLCDACKERNKAILNIYKAEDFTAVILVTEGGVVLDCEVTFKPTSEFARRVAQRAKRYKSRLRVELPEDMQSNTAHEAGAWL